MGVNLRALLVRHETEVSDLKGKVVAFDAFNVLFQFLATIRGPDGSLLTDTKGRPTSHLIGLFSRMSKLLQEGIIVRSMKSYGLKEYIRVTIGTEEENENFVNKLKDVLTS